MRLAVLDYGTGDLDILNLSEEAEEVFNNTEEASEFIKNLGYDEESISWIVLDGLIRERKVTVVKDDVPIIEYD